MLELKTIAKCIVKEGIRDTYGRIQDMQALSSGEAKLKAKDTVNIYRVLASSVMIETHETALDIPLTNDVIFVVLYHLKDDYMIDIYASDKKIEVISFEYDDSDLTNLADNVHIGFEKFGAHRVVGFVSKSDNVVVKFNG